MTDSPFDREDILRRYRLMSATHEEAATNSALVQPKLKVLNGGSHADVRLVAAGTTGPPESAPKLYAPTIPDVFWSARPLFRTIRETAWSRKAAPDAVLGALLARIAAGTPHYVKLADVVGGKPKPLNLFVNLMGPSGSGKTSANEIASGVLPLDPSRVIDQMPIGSGEGLIDNLFDYRNEPDPDNSRKSREVKYQSRFNAYIYVDEGGKLIALGERSGTTLLATLRSAYTGAVLGEANAAKETRRRLEAGMYAFGLVMSLQEEVAGPIIERTNDGTAQRFLWLGADGDPAYERTERGAIPELVNPFGFLDDTIGRRAAYAFYVMPLHPDIEREIDLAGDARMLRKVTAEEVQSHQFLMRLKVAGCLAILDQRADINPEDWHLARLIQKASDGVRAHVQRVIATATARDERRVAVRRGSQQAVANEVTENHELMQVVERVHKVVGERDGISARDMTKAVTIRLRGLSDEAITFATQNPLKGHVIVKRTTLGQGTDRISLHRVKAEPQ